MLLDAETFDLLPSAAEIVDAAARRALQARDARRAARDDAAARAHGRRGDRGAGGRTARPRGGRRSGRRASRRPAYTRSRTPLGVLNEGARYAKTEAEYGVDRAAAARLRAAGPRRGRRRASARSRSTTACARGCPLVAALAANAPFHAGRDTGLASIRPKIAEQLPRQGMPPAIAAGRRSPSARLGRRAGAFPTPRRWWWELRPHPAFGTLEVRVPDAQATVEDAAAVAALVPRAGRPARGAPRRGRACSRPPTPGGIEENRWSACTLGAWMPSWPTSRSGARTPARELLARRCSTELAPAARASGLRRRSWRTRRAPAASATAPRASARSPRTAAPRAVAAVARGRLRPRRARTPTHGGKHAER